MKTIRITITLIFITLVQFSFAQNAILTTQSESYQELKSNVEKLNAKIEGLKNLINTSNNQSNLSK